MSFTELRKRYEALNILVINSKAIRPRVKKTGITNPNKEKIQQQNRKDKEIKYLTATFFLPWDSVYVYNYCKISLSKYWRISKNMQF